MANIIIIIIIIIMIILIKWVKKKVVRQITNARMMIFDSRNRFEKIIISSR